MTRVASQSRVLYYDVDSATFAHDCIDGEPLRHGRADTIIDNQATDSYTGRTEQHAHSAASATSGGYDRIPEASWPYVSSLVVTPDNPPRLYAVISSQLYYSDDRAHSWQPVDIAGVNAQAIITAVAIDYRHATTLYLMTTAGIYRREGEQPWAYVHTLKAFALAVDLFDSKHLVGGGPLQHGA